MATANPNETTSVCRIVKQQRQKSWSTKVAPKDGGSPGSLNRSLDPVLPPSYPPAPKPSMLTPKVESAVKVYNKLSQHFKSNFTIEFKRQDGGYILERYTDQYKAPLALESHLIHMLPDSKFPEELQLGRKLPKQKQMPPRRTFVQGQKRKIEDLSVGDDTVNIVPLIRIKEEPVSEEEDEKDDADVEDDEDEGDLDEEMDVGTDYAMSYFDNGEEYDDDGDEDDGPTYY